MSTRSLLVIVALGLAPACGDDSVTVIIDDPVGDTVNFGFDVGAGLADRSLNELVGNDFLVQIGMTGTILASFNDGEIAESDLAAQLVDDLEIFDFANQLIIDHEDLNFELDSVLRFYGVGYFPSDTADAIAAQTSVNVGVLRGTPPGEVEFIYVENQVINHAAALVLLDQLFVVIGPGDMGDFILDTQDLVDIHLAEAESLLATFY
jgi:hypothetical protein